MAPKTKINLKDRFEDGELDLSLSELQEVPVREIAAIKKASSLDLSNNRLTNLGKNFVTLTHIIKLDLGKNLLTELPDNFGEMKQLKHLDLYHNQLTHLPLSFHQLKSLKWLDLKDNPLVPAVAKVAGPCLDQQQCTQCAKNVVQFFTAMSEQIEEEKLRREKEKLAELEVELATQKKQQKKKEKNKAMKVKKNKFKAERKLESLTITDEQFIGYDYVNELVQNGHPKKSQNNEKQSSSFVKKLFLFILFFAGSLFVFTSIKTEFANNVKLDVIDVWSKFVGFAPDSWQPWILTFNEYVGNVHNLSGKLIDNSVDYLRKLQTNENVQYGCRMFWDFCNLTVAEGKKFFELLGDQAIVIRNEIKRIFVD